jgi:hypothetical protein
MTKPLHILYGRNFARGVCRALSFRWNVQVKFREGPPCTNEKTREIFVPPVRGFLTQEEISRWIGRVLHEVSHWACGSMDYLTNRKINLKGLDHEALNIILDMADETRLESSDFSGVTKGHFLELNSQVHGRFTGSQSDNLQALPAYQRIALTALLNLRVYPYNFSLSPPEFEAVQSLLVRLTKAKETRLPQDYGFSRNVELCRGTQRMKTLLKLGQEAADILRPFYHDPPEPPPGESNKGAGDGNDSGEAPGGQDPSPRPDPRNDPTLGQSQEPLEPGKFELATEEDGLSGGQLDGEIHVPSGWWDDALYQERHRALTRIASQLAQSDDARGLSHGHPRGLGVSSRLVHRATFDPNVLYRRDHHQEAERCSVVLLIDKSGSMRESISYEEQQGKAVHAYTAAKAFADAIQPFADDLHIISFGRDTQLVSRRRIVSLVPADSRTYLDEGLRRAHKILRTFRTRNRLLVVVSDGLPSDRGKTNGRRLCAEISDEIASVARQALLFIGKPGTEVRANQCMPKATFIPIHHVWEMVDGFREMIRGLLDTRGIKV